MSAHTEGRLAVVSDGTNFALTDKQIPIGEGRTVAIVVREDRARRLAACWNACEGIRTEMLEQLATTDPAKPEVTAPVASHILCAEQTIRSLRREWKETIADLAEACTCNNEMVKNHAVEVFEVRHQLDIANVERTTLQRRMAAHRAEFGRLNATVAKLHEQLSSTTKFWGAQSARFAEMQAEGDQLRAELAELKTHLRTVKTLTDERNELKARLGNSADWNVREAELAAARTLLTDILAADDAAIAELRTMGVMPSHAPNNLTERIRALLGGGSAAARERAQ